MEVGKFTLKLDMLMHRARYVARAARTCAAGLSRLRHGRNDVGMMAHAKIVVRAPDRDFTLALWAVVVGLGKRTAAPFHLRENAVVALFLQLVQLIGKQRVKIHLQSSLGLPWARGASSAIVLRQAVAEPSASVRAERAP